MKHKLQKKHFISLAVLLSALALVVVGSIMAFFSSTDQTTNKFIGSRFDISLIEPHWNPDTAKRVVPGDELDKDPQVINREHTNGYIYIRVTVPCDTQMVDNDDGTPLGATGMNVPMYKFVNTDGDYDATFSAKQTVNDHWVLVAENGNDYTDQVSEDNNKQLVYVYAYAENDKLTALKQDEHTNTLFEKLHLWNFNESYDPDQDHSVLVEALGIQSDIPGYTENNINEIWYDILSKEDGN